MPIVVAPDVAPIENALEAGSATNKTVRRAGERMPRHTPQRSKDYCTGATEPVRLVKAGFTHEIV